jgi:hypothetical protein
VDELEVTDAPAPESAPTADLAEPVTQAPEEIESGGTPDLSQTFVIKVAGEEQEISLEEALNNGMRQADYTRKTQELAVERERLTDAERLWNLIEANPQVTLAALAEGYGYKLSPAEQAALEREQAQLDDEPLDPEEQRWQEFDQFRQQVQMERLQAQVDRELTDIHSKYGVGFNDNDLLQYALDNEIGNLETAFRAMAFDRMTQVAEERRVQQKKASAPPIAGGHGVAPGVLAPAPASQLPTIAEAFAAAEAAEAVG